MRHIFAGALVILLVARCAAAVDLKDLDTSVRPQDDFYRYANGGWLKANPIPSDHSSWGSADEVENRNEAILHGILEKAEKAPDPGFIEKLVGDFYFSGMDLPAIERAGISPLRPDLDAVASLASINGVAALVGRLHLRGIGVCFGLASEEDPKNSDMMIAGFGQGGLGLPDRDYYLRTDADSVKLRDEYVAHVEAMLVLSGEAKEAAASDAAGIMRLETELAKGSKTDVELRDPVANYHPTPLAGVQKLSPHFDWGAYLAAIGLPAPAIIDVGQPDFLKALDAQLTPENLAAWKAYLRWHLVSDEAPFLSTPFTRENFDFFVTTLTGTPKQRERWRRVQAEIDENAGEALGQLYVAQAFPPQAKADVLRLVGNIRAALHDRLEEIQWMDEPTRVAALRKLGMLNVKIGYPDKWIDYSALRIDRGPYVTNVQRATQFNVRRDLAKIGKPTDRSLWGITPPTVNAYYDPSMNEIVFAAGILQPPYYDPKADDASNYGAIGAVIGHEMTHGFDDEGRQFDGKGNLTEWWTPESEKRFKERAAAIVRQFSAYVAVGDLHVNGELTQGENIADLGGIKLAYAAFMRDIAGQPQKEIDGFSPEQRFFLSYASVWRANERPETLKLLTNTDPHSPNRWRVDGPLSNLDEFAAAFNVPAGSPMRRPPADRVVIW